MRCSSAQHFSVYSGGWERRNVEGLGGGLRASGAAVAGRGIRGGSVRGAWVVERGRVEGKGGGPARDGGR